MKFHRFSLAASLAVILAWGMTAFAQSDRGAITGTVRDPGGDVVADAKVKVTNIDTNEEREVETTIQSAYRIATRLSGTPAASRPGPSRPAEVLQR